MYDSLKQGFRWRWPTSSSLSTTHQLHRLPHRHHAHPQPPDELHVSTNRYPYRKDFVESYVGSFITRYRWCTNACINQLNIVRLRLNKNNFSVNKETKFWWATVRPHVTWKWYSWRVFELTVYSGIAKSSFFSWVFFTIPQNSSTCLWGQATRQTCTTNTVAIGRWDAQLQKQTELIMYSSIWSTLMRSLLNSSVFCRTVGQFTWKVGYGLYQSDVYQPITRGGWLVYKRRPTCGSGKIPLVNWMKTNASSARVPALTHGDLTSLVCL